jgi:hypothetical protein
LQWSAACIPCQERLYPCSQCIVFVKIPYFSGFRNSRFTVSLVRNDGLLALRHSLDHTLVHAMAEQSGREGKKGSGSGAGPSVQSRLGIALLSVSRGHAVFSEKKGRIFPCEQTLKICFGGFQSNTGFKEQKYRDDRIPFLSCLFSSDMKSAKADSRGYTPPRRKFRAKVAL